MDAPNPTELLQSRVSNLSIIIDYVFKKFAGANLGRMVKTSIRQNRMNMEELNALLMEIEQIMESGHGKFNY